MPRGYWRIVLTIVGFLALTGEHPNPTAQPEQTQTEQSIANSLSDIAATNHDLSERTERPPERKPCGPGEYKSNDDLCAQWKAADAAQLAAWLNIVGLAAVLAALYAAFKSNAIARDSAKRQLRAYVWFDGCDVSTERGFHYVSVTIKNAGQTPADVRGYLVQYYVKADDKVVLSGGTGGGPFMLPPNADIRFDRTGSRILTSLRSGERFHLVVKGIVQFRDIFNKTTIVSAEFHSRSSIFDPTAEPAFTMSLYSQSDRIHDAHMFEGLSLPLEEAESRESGAQAKQNRKN